MAEAVTRTLCIAVLRLQSTVFLPGPPGASLALLLEEKQSLKMPKPPVSVEDVDADDFSQNAGVKGQFRRSNGSDSPLDWEGLSILRAQNHAAGPSSASKYPEGHHGE